MSKNRSCAFDFIYHFAISLRSSFVLKQAHFGYSPVSISLFGARSLFHAMSLCLSLTFRFVALSFLLLFIIESSTPKKTQLTQYPSYNTIFFPFIFVGFYLLCCWSLSTAVIAISTTHTHSRTSTEIWKRPRVWLCSPFFSVHSDWVFSLSHSHSIISVSHSQYLRPSLARYRYWAMTKHDTQPNSVCVFFCV